jgi:hypothetical protein
MVKSWDHATRPGTGGATPIDRSPGRRSSRSSAASSSTRGERGRVRELSGPEGLWLREPTSTGETLTIDTWFKTTDASALQILFAAGGGRKVGPKGLNLYTHD